MNPHSGQYRLGGTLDGWSRLSTATRAQQRRLRFAYRGLLPLVYSRYGVRQWAAPLPWTRVIMKDPFALLSIPVVTQTTGALAVVVFRHPGAVLTSYRRMGWRPDMVEISPLVRLDPPFAVEGAVDPMVSDMARFWTALYRAALEDTVGRSDVILVSHEELARGGPAAMQLLASRCGLVLSTPPPLVGRNPTSERAANGVGPAADLAPPADESGRRLHNFDRRPEDVADDWRASVPDLELDVLKRYTATTLTDLYNHRIRLDVTPDS